MPFAPPNYTLPNLSSGMDDAIVGTVSSVPSFLPMLLVFIFGVITIGGSISQKRRTGIADIPMWSTIASVTTLMVTMALSLTAGLLDSIYTLGVVIGITIFSGIWLFLDRGRNEVV